MGRPESLHEMLGIQDPEILAWVPDYTINLVQPSEINEDDLPKFHSELGQVLQYLHYFKDREKQYDSVARACAGPPS